MDKVHDIPHLHKVAIKKGEELGFDELLLNTSVNNSSQIKFFNNELGTIKNYHNSSSSIFAVRDKRIAATTIKDLQEDQINETFKKLDAFMKYIKPKEDWNGLAVNKNFKYEEVEDFYDKEIEALGAEACEIPMNAIEEALNQGAKRTAGVFEYGTEEDYLTTSHNIDLYEKGTDIRLSIRAMCGEGSGHMVGAHRLLNNLNPFELGKEAGQNAKMSEKVVTGKPGHYKILFKPLSAGFIVENAIEAANMGHIEMGLSCLGNKLGEKIAPDFLTINDNGRMKNGFGSSMFDSEGTPTQKTTVIENGVLKRNLHNYTTAQKYNVESTGNAGLIYPSLTNVEVEPGEMNDDELLAELGNGLIVTNNWYTRYQNYHTGDFSTIPRDACFVVENGEIVQSIKNTRINANLLTMLNNISAVGKKREQLMGWENSTPVLTPSIIVDNVNVSIVAEEEMKKTD